MIWRKHNRREGAAFNTEKVFLAATQPLKTVYAYFQTSCRGLTDEEIKERQKEYGQNEIVHEQAQKAVVMFCKAFINPFIGVLMALAIVSLVIDVWMAAPEEREWTSVVVISTMVLLSVVLRFSQEWKSSRASDALKKMVKNTASVYRNGREESEEVNITELVPGDVVYLAAGDMVPADVRVVESKDLFVSQSALTGESDAVEKSTVISGNKHRSGSVVELDNICFMGSNVVSGSAIAVVFATGKNTYLGTIAKSIVGVRAQTAFDKGISNVSFLLIRFMLVMVPFVFLVNGVTKGDWFEAFIFAISVAVGLTPEMLPMIVTANLSKGAVVMARKKTIVKNLNAIQNFGAMNILCTDKTGTLTRDQIVLEKYINSDGSSDDRKRVLRHAFFNSYFQTGLKNLMDRAILSHVKELQMEYLKDNYMKIDEIPFDFTRRRMSVVVEDRLGKCQIITKGAVEEMLDICAFAEFDGEVHRMTDELRAKAYAISERMNREGMRVLAVAQKSWIEKGREFGVDDEAEMVLIGYLAFLDPPKPSAASAIKQLHEHGVEVKVLSGDNEAVVKTICRQVGVDTTRTLTGQEIERMTDGELKGMVGEVTVFAKLTPMQKTRIITLLQEQDNTVGFLGDGINDASALRQSDVGISVDTAVDIAKESADIILLEKDLMVLEDGVIEGRKTFGNIMKYIKMTASSNFGNMFSVLGASAFLPFLPMLPIHLLVQNLLYDVSQITIPFDRLDAEYLQKPRRWDASDLSRFMIYIGPISSIFDIATYLVMWYVFKCNSPEHQALFQSGWFIEGLLSQTLIVHMIRTRKIPFIQSTASWPVVGLTLLIMVVGIILPFSNVGAAIGLVPLPWSYFPWLVVILLSYCVLTQVIKQWYIKRFTRWL
ncbi:MULTISPECIES: magnesium-translocating P-type ATPase [Butyricimonas]|uniref:magnesium-translocating P-type ATPase n=1 Tax=Butyricimonas TaxID=574697 RepID=UPI000C06F54E|nr:MULTISPECIES: magnesium-translocating P-type ATPase [Butyricimonas]MCB6971799.1 magnesium-translocating P-type ATPase [Butyricimonas synergistica]MCG4518593.1 magnesium-translocating P-type ATPase [Butyricimonas sp. DFI.6.44]